MRAAEADGDSTTTASVVEPHRLAQVPEFGLRGTYAANGLVLTFNGRKAGVVVQMPAPDGRVYFLTQRHRNHILRFPRPSWAFACSLIERLSVENVSWLRVEMVENGKRKSWEAPLCDLLEQPPSYLIQRGGFELQAALALRSWIYVDEATIQRELFGWRDHRPAKRRPA